MQQFKCTDCRAVFSDRDLQEYRADPLEIEKVRCPRCGARLRKFVEPPTIQTTIVEEGDSTMGVELRSKAIESILLELIASGRRVVGIVQFIEEKPRSLFQRILDFFFGAPPMKTSIVIYSDTPFIERHWDDAAGILNGSSLV